MRRVSTRSCVKRQRHRRVRSVPRKHRGQRLGRDGVHCVRQRREHCGQGQHGLHRGASWILRQRVERHCKVRTWVQMRGQRFGPRGVHSRIVRAEIWVCRLLSLQPGKVRRSEQLDHVRQLSKWLASGTRGPIELQKARARKDSHRGILLHSHCKRVDGIGLRRQRRVQLYASLQPRNL